MDEYYHTEHDSKSTVSILDKINEYDWVANAYIYNSDEELKYSSKYKPIVIKDLEKRNPLAPNKKVNWLRVNQYSRILVEIENKPACYACHNPMIKKLGYAIYDVTIEDSNQYKNISFKFSLIYGVFMVLIIASLVILMHYKSIRKSLNHFHSKIEIINKGALNERLDIPKDKELGELGKKFNEMLDNFQKTQNELLVFHKKELSYNKKLATIGEMAARLAHEIRNPITGIANAIEIIVDEMGVKGNKPILEEIRRQARRVNDAVSSLLIYSRSKDLNLHEQDINELISSLVLFLKSQNHNKEISFNLDLQPEVPTFKFDQEKIENALLNLGLNAIQSIEHSGSVTFQTNYDPLKKVVNLAVEDTGVGIPENTVSEIFTPFYTTRTEGTGLGLAIVKDIVEKHSGEIWVEKNKVKGSIFYISLPLET